MAEAFRALWETLLPIGADPAGGWTRPAWSDVDLEARAWFTREATARGLAVETDRNGNLFAWLGDPGAGGAVVTGSHLDSVPHGGAYDGALGVASALLALDLLAARGATPRRPVAVAVFAAEEGARFGVPCLGSGLLTGAVEPDRARALTDAGGVSLAQAMRAAGVDPDRIGPDPARLARIGHFVELHVEQGWALAEIGAPVGVGSGIWPHGRWRMSITGTGDHAGTAAMAGRRDPLLTAAYAVLAANKEARLRGGRATVGQLVTRPGATNAIAANVSLWLDARAADPDTLAGLVAAVAARVTERAGRDRTSVTVHAESQTPPVTFDPDLRRRLVAALGGAPVLATAAGHDAGVLAAHIPTGMLFVRNPSGVSHAPDEAASDADCAAGVAALADVLQELAC
ncbi:MAG TPA: allantoate amidohydrolase [Natronosporangium sp.]|nr:allantoate amidohydrolase [Natronosporangium sp.]